jgi:hypothetical protein
MRSVEHITDSGAPALVALMLGVLSMSGCSGSAADGSGLDELLPRTISSWTMADSNVTYDRETIFDYINGAGEVYRSYDFGEVLVATYESPEQPYVLVELFDMGNAADAYGVFSYARETEELGIGGGYEQRGRVICFWQDRYYVCVSTEERTAESDEYLAAFARSVSEQLPAVTDPPDLVQKLPTEGLVRFSERFFHLHQSLNYQYYVARENLLHLNSETDAVMARYAPGSSYLLLVQYPDEGNASDALASFKQVYVPDAGMETTVQTENGQFVSFAQEGSYLALVLDAPSETGASDLLQAALDKLE